MGSFFFQLAKRIRLLLKDYLAHVRCSGGDGLVINLSIGETPVCELTGISFLKIFFVVYFTIFFSLYFILHKIYINK